jgi:hypothetical protein
MAGLLRSVVLVALVFAGGTASAGGPSRDFTGLMPGDFFDFEGPCDFPVRIEIVHNNEYTLTFSPDEAGTTRQLVNGRFVVSVTNLDSGASLSLNVSGPGEYLYFADGSILFTGDGPWLIFFFPGQRGPGTPGALFVNDGRIVLHTDPLGTQTVLEQVGTQEDVCAALE